VKILIKNTNKERLKRLEEENKEDLILVCLEAANKMLEFNKYNPQMFRGK